MANAQKVDGVLGTDLSAAQGPNVDFATFVANGIQFVIPKATQGEKHVDSSYERNAREACAAVEFVGGYHWYEPRQDPIRQAAHAVDLVGEHVLSRATTPMGVMIDFEDDDRSDPRGPVHGRDLVQGASAFVLEVERLSGWRVLVYSGKYFWMEAVGSYDAPVLSSRSYCHAAYPRSVCPGGKKSADYIASMRALPQLDPAAPWKGKRVDFWQFDGDKGLVLPQGVDADFDRFDGTVAELRAWCRGQRIGAITKELGLELGDRDVKPSNVIGFADRAEQLARERSEASTNPDVPTKQSSDRIAQIKLPVEDPDATWNGEDPKGGGGAA